MLAKTYKFTFKQELAEKPGRLVWSDSCTFGLSQGEVSYGMCNKNTIFNAICIVLVIV